MRYTANGRRVVLHSHSEDFVPFEKAEKRKRDVTDKDKQLGDINVRASKRARVLELQLEEVHGEKLQAVREKKELESRVLGLKKAIQQLEEERNMARELLYLNNRVIYPLPAQASLWFLLAPFCDLLEAKDNKIVHVILDGLAYILATAEKLGELDEIAMMIHEAGGIDKIEQLLSHNIIYI